MEESDAQIEIPKIKQTGLIAGGISIALVLIIILQHNLAFQKESKTIIPAGNTYLGPKDEATPTTAPVTETPGISPTPTDKTNKTATTDVFMNKEGKIEASDTVPLVTINGKKYPYSFQAPKALKLVPLASDTFDIFAIAWEDRPPDQNVLVGVDNLTRSDSLKQYINVSKRSYVESWWKQFGTLKGVASITEFTNSKGLKGYRAKYLTANNQTPNDDVFFEVSDPKYVIHLASGILDISLFNTIIDTVAWSK